MDGEALRIMRRDASDDGDLLADLLDGSLQLTVDILRYGSRVAGIAGPDVAAARVGKKRSLVPERLAPDFLPMRPRRRGKLLLADVDEAG